MRWIPIALALVLASPAWGLTPAEKAEAISESTKRAQAEEAACKAEGGTPAEVDACADAAWTRHSIRVYEIEAS